MEASKSALYNFDFKAGCPLERNSASRFLWEEIHSKASLTEASNAENCKIAAVLLESSEKSTLMKEMSTEENLETCVQTSNGLI